jgi:hypothetical protein
MEAQRIGKLPEAELDKVLAQFARTRRSRLMRPLLIGPETTQRRLL